MVTFPLWAVLVVLVLAFGLLAAGFASGFLYFRQLAQRPRPPRYSNLRGAPWIGPSIDFVQYP